jgi:hypothetical protein
MIEGNPESPQSIVYDHSEKKLGSEISGDPTFDNASNWSVSLGNGGVDVNTTVSGKLSVVNAQDTRLYKYSILTVGNLYKVTFVVDSYSSGRVRGLLDNAITFTPTEAGTYTRYFIASNTFFLVSFDGTANMTMTDISIKEVLMGNHATTSFFGDMSDVLSSTEKSNLGNLLDSDDNSFVFPNGEDITDTITLGSELLNYDFADGTGVTVPSSLSSLTTFNGEMVINGGSVSSDYYSIADSTTWDVNKVYKIVVVCSAYTSGSISHQGGSASFGINFGVSSSIGGVGTFTNYAVPFQDGTITLRSQSFVGTISSISIKEATTTKFFNLAGTDSIDSNTLKLLNDGTTKAHVVYPFTTVIGKSYSAEIKLTTANMQGGLSLSDDLEENTLSTASSSGSIITSNTFVATRTKSYVHIKNNQGNNNQYNLYDNLKIREVGISSSGFMPVTNEPIIPQIPLMRYNQVMLFDGTDDIVDCGDIHGIDGTTKLTINAWMKRSQSDSVVTVGKTQSSNYRVSINLFNDGNLYANLAIGSSYAFGSVSLIGTDWNYISYVFDGTQSGNSSRLKVYINGVAQTLSFSGGDIPSSIPPTTATFKIGKDNANNIFSKGCIKDVSVFNEAFSVSEVQEIFNDGVAYDATTHSKADDHLLGYWRNDGVTTWTDRSDIQAIAFNG